MVDVTQFEWKEHEHDKRLEEVLKFIADRLSLIESQLQTIALESKKAPPSGN